MTVGRRNFLRLFAASPLAAKAATDKAVAELVGITGNGAAGIGTQSPPFGNPTSLQGGSAEWRATKFGDFFRRFGGLPEWELDRIKREARSIYGLDPDIAALRSFSMNAKICMQRERNIEREIERMKSLPAYDQMRDEFQKKHGFWFWW